MKQLPKALLELIEALCILPGIGQKSATRMAIFLLDKNRQGAESITKALQNALSDIDQCQQCFSLADQPLCPICSDKDRDQAKLCVVESPLDLIAIENTNVFNGRYFVLNGRISPLDGVGAKELKIDHLIEMINQYEINELILAVSPTVEGEATAHYINDVLAHKNLKISRLGYGVPFGGELEYLDQQTLFHAFNARLSC
ncbi:recombination mediator RecR [Thiotrichales bacterium 19S9-12]|nr:recombination mediator RecR [Thiotrichales bacterium 19S9-11]MCF6811101.1 recombination mediator RecR [Thiotrichales bacterium 19S9-12]